MARLSATSSPSNGHIPQPQIAAEHVTVDDGASGNKTSPAAEHVTFDDRLRQAGLDRTRRNDEEDHAGGGHDGTEVPIDASLAVGGSRDLSSIGLQAFLCGSVFSGGIFLTILLLYHNITWWRLPAFLASLGAFHFLEYWTTARYNLPALRASSFLIFSNGAAYRIAHTGAALEIIISNFFPAYQGLLSWRITMIAGTVMVVVCQIIRSVAMCQAGKSFNHIVAQQRKDSHVLVTSGLYAYFRHPSYFGYFWWALGTQLMVGNKICFVGFVAALFNFFSRRIRAEETYLVEFFGEKYVDYRKRVGTMIPFIP